MSSSFHHSLGQNLPPIPITYRSEDENYLRGHHSSPWSDPRTHAHTRVWKHTCMHTHTHTTISHLLIKKSVLSCFLVVTLLFVTEMSFPLTIKISISPKGPYQMLPSPNTFPSFIQLELLTVVHFCIFLHSFSHRYYECQIACMNQSSHWMSVP